MTKDYITYSRENGGRVLVLFLLFILAIYQFINAGYNSFVIICCIPIAIPIIYAIFRWQMLTFWLLFFLNYFILFFAKERLLPGGVPVSLINEILEIVLIAVAIIDFRKVPAFDRSMNLMLLSLLAWSTFCTLEILNDTCGLGINVGSWYQGARLMAFQLVYAFIVFTLYIDTPDKLINYLKIWALFTLFSVFWTWKQKNMGFTTGERIWLDGGGSRTHILNGGSLIRYFSTFSDSANYGINAAASAVVFTIIAITTKIKREKIFYSITAVLIIWGMFQSGTRTAIFCLAAGFMVYIVLSKSFKIAIPFSIAFILFACMLIFTDIGNGNQQIRRMRSAFNKDDASANVRDVNQEAIRKYLKDAPWGIGLGMDGKNIPANNKYNIVSTIPPDSEYVFIWIRTGIIGISFFILCTILMFLGACCTVFFKLKNRSLIGIGGGLCSAFLAIQLGGYANQVLMQFPNCLIFYGGLAIVYVLPYIEPEWIKMENERLAKQEEMKRLKLEKKLAKRV